MTEKKPESASDSYDQCNFIKQNGERCKCKSVILGYCCRHLTKSEEDFDIFDDDLL